MTAYQVAFMRGMVDQAAKGWEADCPYRLGSAAENAYWEGRIAYDHPEVQEREAG